MQNLVIDISKRGVIPPIIVTEYDSMSRFFTLRLLNNGADYTPPENANYSVWYETNDSKGWYDTITLPDETSRSAVVEDGNVLTVEIAEAATTSCGELAVMVTGNDGYQMTVAGIRLMSADVPGYGGAEVEDYYNVYIADMQKNAARAENAAQTAIEYGATIDVEDETLIIDHYDDAGEVETWATVSEAWAVGKRNGVDVPSTDETYHNNSKYYAGQAANSAVNAAASAETAEEAAELCFTTAIKTSASGAVASFSDGADDIPMQSVVAEITPVQSGSGDPSPTNIRPISGRTGMTVTRAGKNLAIPGYNEETVISGLTITPTEKGIRVRGTATARRAIDLFTVADNYRHIPLAEGTKITVSLYKNGDISAAENPFVGYYANGAYGGNVGTLLADNNYTLSWTVTAKYADAYDSYLRAYMYIPSGATVDFEIGLQIEIDTSATGYEPYAGQTYPITWESIAGTVYGGTLDVVSGVLTVDRAMVEFDGSSDETWTALATEAVFRHNAPTPLASVEKRTQTITNETNVTTYSYSTMKVNYPSISFDTNSRLFLAISDEYTTVAQCREWLAANPLQVCYYLATPQTYQLTPTEVLTLLGGNTIYTDAGDVSVEYVADTKLYIDNKIAELQALVLEN